MTSKTMPALLLRQHTFRPKQVFNIICSCYI